MAIVQDIRVANRAKAAQKQLLPMLSSSPLQANFGIILWTDNLVTNLHNLGTWVTAIQQEVKTGPYGEVLALVDPGVIAVQNKAISLDNLLDNPPEDLTRPVDWNEGFPTIHGVPIWERLEGELPSYFKLFQAYRTQLETGMGARSMQKLAALTQTPSKALLALSQLYHWKLRVISYDTYQLRVRENIRNQMVTSMESKHARAAEKLFDSCAMVLDEDRISSMSNKDLIETMKMATELHRISMGLFPNKPMDASQAQAVARATAPNMQGATINNIQVNNDSSTSFVSGGQGGLGSSVGGGQGKSSEGSSSRTSEILDILLQCEAFGPLAKLQASIIEIETETETETDKNNEDDVETPDANIYSSVEKDLASTRGVTLAESKATNNGTVGGTSANHTPKGE